MGMKLGSAKVAAKRRALPAALAAHRWRPGQSGNPSGHSGDYGDALRLARQAAPDAVRRLVELMASDDERVAAVACNAIFDRAYGKPAPAADPPIEKMPLLEIIERLTRDQLDEFATALRASLREDEPEDDPGIVVPLNR